MLLMYMFHVRLTLDQYLVNTRLVNVVFTFKTLHKWFNPRFTLHRNTIIILIRAPLVVCTVGARGTLSFIIQTNEHDSLQIILFISYQPSYGWEDRGERKDSCFRW